ncbi:MFS transporter [Acinetobacter stercoris]|uniref:Purine efflux pump PbuE n=1 Tax=Acinetobacter stercoris TaxID=2126983 RepID=A0A2U3N3L9_9GAMM|nr:MFS transporter [Acinetobacter stercoris]SPL72149.1 Purine efflux pump PbuE [Acinetobacter stercoris]
MPQSDVMPLRLWNRNFIFCVLNNLFLFTYYYAFLTILPIYIMQNLGGSIQEAGLALTLFLVSSIAVRPFAGFIIQKIGTRKAFLGSALLFVIFAFSYLLADQLWILLTVRFIHGIWFSILTTVAVPIASEFIPEQRKGEGIGYYVMSTNLAVVIGPFIALTMTQFVDFRVLFLILTVIITLGFTFCVMIPVQDKVEKCIDVEPINRNKKRALSFTDLIEMRAVPIGLVAMLTAFAYSSVMSFITAYSEMKHLFAYTSIFFVVFAMSMIVVRPWIGKIYDRIGPNAVVVPSFIFFAVGLVVLSLVSNPWLLWLSAVFIGIGYGSLFPCFQTLAIQSSPKHRMGHAISTFFTLFDLGMAIGSVVIGLSIARFGFELSYIFCAGISIVTLFLYRSTITNPKQLVKGG